MGNVNKCFAYHSELQYFVEKCDLLTEYRSFAWFAIVINEYKPVFQFKHSCGKCEIQTMFVILELLHTSIGIDAQNGLGIAFNLTSIHTAG